MEFKHTIYRVTIKFEHKPNFIITIVVVVTFLIRTFNSNGVCQMKQLGFIIFQPPNAAAGMQTYVSRVAPNQLDLLKVALPYELPCPG